jgi:hypothetical protein
VRQQKSSAICDTADIFHLSQILPSACINNRADENWASSARPFLLEPRKNFRLELAKAQIDTL